MQSNKVKTRFNFNLMQSNTVKLKLNSMQSKKVKLKTLFNSI